MLQFHSIFCWLPHVESTDFLSRQLVHRTQAEVVRHSGDGNDMQYTALSPSLVALHPSPSLPFFVLLVVGAILAHLGVFVFHAWSATESSPPN